LVKGFGQMMSAAIREAELPPRCKAHGLRKILAILRAALAIARASAQHPDDTDFAAPLGRRLCAVAMADRRGVTRARGLTKCYVNAN
jgi:hypothetical protein